MCFRKRGSLVGGGGREQIPVLRKREGWVGSCFVANRKKSFRKTNSFGQNCITSNFLRTKAFWQSLKILPAHIALVHPKAMALHQTVYQSTPVSPFHRNKDNVQLSFSSTVCGVKPQH